MNAHNLALFLKFLSTGIVLEIIGKQPKTINTSVYILVLYEHRFLLVQKFPFQRNMRSVDSSSIQG